MDQEQYMELLEDFISLIRIEGGKIFIDFILEDQAVLQTKMHDNLEFEPSSRLQDLHQILQQIILPPVTVTREVITSAAQSIEAVEGLQGYLQRNFQERNDEGIHHLQKFCKELADTVDFMDYKCKLLARLEESYEDLSSNIQASNQLLYENLDNEAKDNGENKAYCRKLNDAREGL